MRAVAWVGGVEARPRAPLACAPRATQERLQPKATAWQPVCVCAPVHHQQWLPSPHTHAGGGGGGATTHPMQQPCGLPSSTAYENSPRPHAFAWA